MKPANKNLKGKTNATTKDLRIKQCLLALRKNQFNLQKTYRETGMTPVTLSKYLKSHGDKIYKEEDDMSLTISEVKLIKEAEVEAEMKRKIKSADDEEIKRLDEEIKREYVILKYDILQKLKDMLENASDIRKTAEVYKIINDAHEGNGTDANGNKSNTGSWYQQINNNIIKNIYNNGKPIQSNSNKGNGVKSTRPNS